MACDLKVDTTSRVDDAVVLSSKTIEELFVGARQVSAEQDRVIATFGGADFEMSFHLGDSGQDKLRSDQRDILNTDRHDIRKIVTATSTEVVPHQEVRHAEYPGCEAERNA